MFREHYPALFSAYLVALGGWLLASRLIPRLWPREKPDHLPQPWQPWREFGIALIGAAGVLAAGRLWSRGVRLPEGGSLGPLAAALNQVLIFAPILLVPLLRRHSWVTAWLPRHRFAARLAVGLLLSGVALSAYSLFRDGADHPWVLLGRIWRYDQIDEMIQVFLEDVTIAILFVRLASAVGKHWATGVVACLFAAGHIPAMVSGGASWSETAWLVRDAGLGAAVILVIQRSRDVVWFWGIHFSLDMTQFAWISGID